MYYPRKIPSSFQAHPDCVTAVSIPLESREKGMPYSRKKSIFSPLAALLFLEFLKKETKSASQNQTS